MAIPPRDGDGIVAPHDDRETICDDDKLVRYLNSKQNQVVKDQDGSYRASSAGFAPSSLEFDKHQGMSVDMLKSLEADGVEPSSRLKKGQDSAAVITAGELRKLGLRIGLTLCPLIAKSGHNDNPPLPRASHQPSTVA